MTTSQRDTSGVRESPLIFQGPHAQLFGVMHEAAQDVPLQRPFVFCHPFAEEKLWSHRALVTYARRLAARGWPVLRFDYTGHGDSAGRFADFTAGTALDDIGAAIEQAKQACGATTVGLFGLRLGATLAALAGDARRDVDALVLWAPILDPPRYTQELLRINLTTQMAVYKEIRLDREALVAQMRQGQAVNVDGYDVTLPLYDSLMALEPAHTASRFHGQVFAALVQMAGRPAPAREQQQLAARYPAANIQVVIEDPFWKEIARFYDSAPNLAEATDRWLEGR